MEMRNEETSAAGAWDDAQRLKPQELSVVWEGREAAFDKLPGWKAPLWRVADGSLELLRPEGRWRASLEGAPAAFRLREAGADGWMSRRGMLVTVAAHDGAWFDQNGVRQDPARLDAEARPGPELEGHAGAVGEIAKWELADDGFAVAWLDDSFERGPFSCRRFGAYLIVSDGSRKVAYMLGGGHWAWAMVERGTVRLLIGRGGGWEAEREAQPLML